MPFRVQKLLWLLGILVALMCRCGGGTPREGGFAGLGEGHVATLGTELEGEVQLRNFTGGKIVVEARATFPCPQGRCPVIERAPLGVTYLDAPGPFHLHLTGREDNTLIIASYFPDSGGVRVAPYLLKDAQAAPGTIILNLDRPYGPLR